MDGPTKVLTIGIGALAAVAAYLGWQNSVETPEIIDSEVHDYDSKVKQTNTTKVAGVFSNTIESEEDEDKTEQDRGSKVKVEKNKTEKENIEQVVKESQPEEVEESQPEEVNEQESKEETKEVKAEVKAEVKKHMDKLPYESPCGSFWRSEYDEMSKEKQSEN